MKKPASGNMYGIALEESWELFGDRLQGSAAALVCALSRRPPSARSRSALDSTASALGYGRDACVFATAGGLDDRALFLMVEGLDPLCLVACDQSAAHALGRAYRCEAALGKPGRAFGRSFVSFRDFDALLDDEQGKQEAWGLLKKLPRLERP